MLDDALEVGMSGARGALPLPSIRALFMFASLAKPEPDARSGDVALERGGVEGAVGAFGRLKW